jgi:hypothetical protein
MESKDVFDRRRNFSILNAQNLIAGEAIVSIPDTSGKDQRSSVPLPDIEPGWLYCLLLRIKPDLEDENSNSSRSEELRPRLQQHRRRHSQRIAQRDIIIANPAFTA